MWLIEQLILIIATIKNLNTKTIVWDKVEEIGRNFGKAAYLQ